MADESELDLLRERLVAATARQARSRDSIIAMRDKLRNQKQRNEELQSSLLNAVTEGLRKDEANAAYLRGYVDATEQLFRYLVDGASAPRKEIAEDSTPGN